MRAQVLAPAALALLAAPAAAQIVVLDGDDLPTVVAGAPDGETIVINSDQTFVGTLSWAHKELTIRPGLGFEPTIKGSDDLPAIFLSEPGMEVVVRDIRLERGDEVAGNDFIYSVEQTMLQADPAPLRFRAERCVMDGQVRIGFGPPSVQYTLIDCELAGLSASSYTSDEVTVNLSGCSLSGQLFVDSLDDSVMRVNVLDSELGRANINSRDTSDNQATIRRCRIHGSTTIQAPFGGNGPEVVIESSLFEGPGGTNTLTGLFTDTLSTVRAVNLTLTGWGTGLETNVGTTLDNIALFGNADDLHPVLIPIQIADSLIEDGTFAGINGNFAGTPAVDAEYRLVPGSIGIDAGANVPDLGPKDLGGDSRVQDGDGDGTARVNVGAFETLASCDAPATFVYANGSGLNPQALTLSAPPVVGGALTVDVQPTPATVVTVLAVGLGAPSPTVFPGVSGELLLSLDVFPLLSTAAGTHVLPIPSDLALCGVDVALQGVLAEVVGGAPRFSFTNAAVLTFGS